MVSQALGYDKNEPGVERDFPQLYQAGNSRHLWVAADQDQLMAHAGFYPAAMQLEGGVLPVAAIGGVCTKDAFRGQGLASLLIERCVDEAKKEGAALVFLWSDKHDFYKKIGFHLLGRQWAFELSVQHAPALRALGEKAGLPASALRVSEGGADGELLRQSHALLGDLALGPARTFEEHALYLGKGSCRVVSAWAGDQLAAYFAIGKGKDLRNYVHEWAGQEGALHHLAAQCLESFGHSLFLLSPQFMPEEAHWIYALDELGIPARPEYLALVKLLDFEKVRKAVGEYLARLGLDPSALRLSREGAEFLVRWKEEAPGRFSEADFLHLIFGPELPAHPELKGFLPMRLWYWGMDSV